MRLVVFDDFMQKLVLARQVRFEKGSVSLLNKRVVMFNSSFFSCFINRNHEEPKQMQTLYYSVKDSFSKDFAEGVGKDRQFKFRDFVEWMTGLAMMTGWGVFSWENLKEDKFEGIIYVEKSPVVMDLKNTAKYPVDHAIRGFIAGGASAAFKKNIDVVEEKCQALGDKKCRFVFKLSENFDRSDKQILFQLGEKDDKN